MIQSMYHKNRPFAICIGTIELGTIQLHDIFAVVVRENPNCHGFKKKGFRSISDICLSRDDREWFLKNRDLFTLVCSGETGRVYEPNYCNFKEAIRIRQREFTFIN